ncbi:MAG: ABC transporter permease [Acidobacteriota bacterium]|nr:ABC transporter permease [Acidobacteriota bacterium]
MERILLVARNVVRGALSKRAVYIWGAAVLLMFIRAAPAIFIASDDAGRMAFMRSSAVAASLDLWAVLCVASAIFLGANAVASEIASKTIVTLLARPIRRWEFMTGKWIGVVVFSLISLAIGVVLDYGIAAYLGIDIDEKVLGVSLAHTASSIVLFGGVAVALSAVGSAGGAAALTALLVFMPPLIQILEDDPGVLRRRAGVALNYAMPPGYDSHYASIAWAPFPTGPNPRNPPRGRPRPVIDYQAERKEMYQNVGYALVYFAIGCALFVRRDVKLS